jgi:hypothetical protein
MVWLTVAPECDGMLDFGCSSNSSNGKNRAIEMEDEAPELVD